MKKIGLIRSLAVITGLLLQFNLSAQVSPVTLHVETAGSLPSLIAANMKNEITDLTLTGNLNGTDIRFIREMAGSSVGNGKLAVLDLSGVNIVEGGDYYYYFSSNYFYTTDNILGSYFFYGCAGLTSLTIPNSVTAIGDYAFLGCAGLTSITIPNSVSTIGDYAFYDCWELTSITIPNSVTTIGDYAFMDCTGLTSATIGNSVTTIGERAFQNCTGLTSLTIPNSVTTIGSSAFAGCSKLTNITLGNSVSFIGNGAFIECNSLTEVHSNNPIPPQMQMGAYYRCFMDYTRQYGRLFVPTGSYDAYKYSYEWVYFANIIEENVTSNEIAAAKPVKIYSNNGNLYIETDKEESVRIYNINGQTVKSLIVRGKQTIPLERGLYIVRVNDYSEKIVIR